MPTEPGPDLGDRVQAHVDEVEYLYAANGETPHYLGYVSHLRAELRRGADCALVPSDPNFWWNVVDELERRHAGVVTVDNADRFRLIEE